MITTSFTTRSPTTLAFGAWYNTVTEVVFNDGSDNDVVNQYLYDEGGNLVGSATGLKSWEEGSRQFGYNGGVPFAVDAVQFQARGAASGDVAYVDDLTYSVTAVPEPASVWPGRRRRPGPAPPPPGLLKA